MLFPRIEFLTLYKNCSRFLRISSAASVNEDVSLAYSEGQTFRTRTFVQRIVCVWLQEEVLQADHDRVEVQNWLPVLTEDVQANVALQINVWMINLEVGESVTC